MSWIEDAKGANLPSDEEVAAGRREIAKAEHAKAIRELTAHLDTFLDDFRQAGYKVDITFIENPSAYVALIVSVRIENLAMLSISSGSSIEIVNIGSYQEAGADSEGYDDGTRFVPMHGFHNGILNDSVRGGSPAELIAKLKQKLFRMLSDIEKLRKSGRLITQEDAEKANKKGAEEVKKKLKKSKSWWR